MALRDVARYAGVSVGTTANVFAGKPTVSAANRAAVLDAAAELDYKHRPLVHRPRTAISMLGLVVRAEMGPLEANPFYSQILHGAQSACAEASISLAYEMLASSAEQGEELPLVVRRNHVQGLLVAGYVEPRFLYLLVQSRVPFVLVDHDIDPPVADSVRANDERGGYLATRHLLDLGHRDPVPATITGPQAHPSVRDRLAGYRRAIREQGLTCREELIRTGELGLDGGRQQMSALLDVPAPPTAVFCVNDLTAQGALATLRERGVRVPDDYSVIGYDDLDAAATTVPPLTTMRVDKYTLAAEAARCLISRIESPTSALRHTYLDVQLVERASTTRRRPGAADGQSTEVSGPTVT